MQIVSFNQPHLVQRQSLMHIYSSQLNVCQEDENGVTDEEWSWGILNQARISGLDSKNAWLMLHQYSTIFFSCPSLSPLTPTPHPPIS